MIELEFEEAHEIFRVMLKKEGKQITDFPTDTIGQALVGIVGAFRIAQEMGYKLERPVGSIFSKVVL
jgi:hypothetical protein